MTDASGVQTSLVQISQVEDLGVWLTNSFTLAYSSMSESSQQSHAGNGNDKITYLISTSPKSPFTFA